MYVKKLSAIILTLLLLFGLQFWGALNSYAANDFSNFSLSDDGAVQANYSDTAKQLSITGTGVISYEKWVQMAKRINVDYYNGDAWSQSIDESFTIVFNGAANKSIKLCGTGFNGGLFQNFSGNISFDVAVDIAASATDLSKMFQNATMFNEWLEWDTSNVTNMNSMFYGASSFNQPLNFNTFNVTDMGSMFYGANSFNQRIDFDTSKVIDMGHMFVNATDFAQPIDFDISQVADIDYMFHGCGRITSVELYKDSLFDLDISSHLLSSQHSALENFIFNGLSNFSIYDFAGDYMLKHNSETAVGPKSVNGIGSESFVDGDSYHLYTTDFETQKNIKACQFSDLDNYLYNGTFFKPTVQVSDGDTVLTKGVDYSLSYYDNRAVGTARLVIKGKGLYHGSKTLHFNIFPQNSIVLSNDGGVTASYDSAAKRLVIGGHGTINRNKWMEMARLFDAANYEVKYVGMNAYYNTCKYGWRGIEKFDIGFVNDDYGEIVFPQDSKSLFAHFDQQVYFAENAIDTSGVQSMLNMFNGATRFNQALNFDTSNVSNMGTMFKRARSFNQPLNFDTSNVENMFGLFYDASSFNRPLPLDTSSVNNMNSMFRGAGRFNQSLSFNTANVETMDSMFESARSFNSPLFFDTSNVTNMASMFWGASAFNQVLNFNTSKVEDMSNMFIYTEGFYQWVEFDISSLRKALSMFEGSSVEGVTLKNVAGNLNVAANDMFYRCNHLKYLEFKGLKNVVINRFSGNYYVRESEGVAIAKSAPSSFSFNDNQDYRVYLQAVERPQLNLRKSGNAIKVNWKPVSAATGYQVYRADKASGPFKKFKTTGGLVYTNAGALVPGMPYFYKVRAYRKDGSSYTFGDFSEVKGYYAPGELETPDQPNLTLDENAGGIRLNWDEQDRITGYQIYRGISTDKDFGYLKTASGSAQAYTNLSGLTTGRPYYYKVRAYRMAKGVREYGEFSEIKGLFAGTDEAALDAVDFSLEDNPNVSAPNVRVRWQKVAGADGYCVYRWDGVHKRWIGLKKTGPNARVYTNINGVVDGKTNYYAMRPYHISGNKTYYGNVGKSKGFKAQ